MSRDVPLHVRSAWHDVPRDRRECQAAWRHRDPFPCDHHHHRGAGSSPARRGPDRRRPAAEVPGLEGHPDEGAFRRRSPEGPQVEGPCQGDSGRPRGVAAHPEAGCSTGPTSSSPSILRAYIASPAAASSPRGRSPDAKGRACGAAARAPSRPRAARAGADRSGARGDHLHSKPRRTSRPRCDARREGPEAGRSVARAASARRARRSRHASGAAGSTGWGDNRREVPMARRVGPAHPDWPRDAAYARRGGRPPTSGVTTVPKAERPGEPGALPEPGPGRAQDAAGPGRPRVEPATSGPGAVRHGPGAAPGAERRPGAESSRPSPRGGPELRGPPAAREETPQRRPAGARTRRGVPGKPSGWDPDGSTLGLSR